MKTCFRLTTAQYAALKSHLIKGDGLESVSLALCGIRCSDQQVIITINEVVDVPDDSCSLRSADAVRWPVEIAIPLFTKALRRGMAVVKVHSHPRGFDRFSTQDDNSDSILYRALRNMADDQFLFGSAFIVPDGKLSARIYGIDDHPRPVDRVSIVGDVVQIIDRETTAAQPNDEATLRTRQAFGEATTSLLRRLTVGVVGCSGTGSWIVEMLGRLNVGRLILVDPDVVEGKNLNRIVNSTADDAEKAQPKPIVLARAVMAMGMNTYVETYLTDLDNREAVLALAKCDFLFGCVDSADGRDALNRIAIFYLVPFLDIGVRLDADGKGGIRQITAALHYLLPGGSTLLTRGVITAQQVSDHALWRTDRARYESLKAEGYVHGVAVDSPAVVSINGFVASHAVNEMLARLHPFRVDDNAEYRHQVFSLTEGIWVRVPDDCAACEYFGRKVGRGDCRPLIENPAIK